MFLFISFALFLFFGFFFSKFHYDLLINLDCYNSKLIIIRINVLIFILSIFLKKKCLFLAILGLCYKVQAFSSCHERGLLSSRDAWASHCGGFFHCGAWALGT